MKISLLFLLSIVFNSVIYGQSALNDLKRMLEEPKMYRTYGQGNSDGLDIGIRYLDGWTDYSYKPSERPYVVKKFEKSINDRCGVEYSILVQKNDKILSKADLKREIQGLKGDERFAIVAEKYGLYVDAQPAASVEMKVSETVETNGADLTVYIHMKTVGIIYKNYFVTIGYSVGGDNEQETDALYNEYKPFFSAITNGFVIYSQWNK
jgi:hypothetical protein